MSVKVAKIKDFDKSIQKLMNLGGKPQKIAKKALEILGAASIDEFIEKYRLTNHGESRINHCIKFDLGDGYRLVTIINKGVRTFLYCEKHELAEKWIEHNRGIVLTSDNEGIVESVRISNNISGEEERINAIPDYSTTKLFDRLSMKDQDLLFREIQPSVIKKFMLVDTLSSDYEILNILLQVDDESQQKAIFDALLLLREGNVIEAERRISVYSGERFPIDLQSDDILVEIKDGESVKIVNVDSDDYRNWVVNISTIDHYYDWLLFTHPEQQYIIDTNYPGPTKLSGVSGSGKTIIIVKRAIRLASLNPKKPVLILTLNRSLAKFIDNLVTIACADESIRRNVQIKSLFDLFRDILIILEPLNEKIYNDITWLSEEHIDEIWREYYRCLNNNFDAEILFDTYKSLNSRGINGEKYIREEVDWIRSAVFDGNITEYLSVDKVERVGRVIPFDRKSREQLVRFLKCWEDKMIKIGAHDSLGLCTKLQNHLGSIEPEYSSILVDEVQDFGTTELAILRKLVVEGVNDIFLCGDLAQRVSTKHMNLKEAGINIPSKRSLVIRRNYRNSREILQIAYDILENATGGFDQIKGDFEIIQPILSNFSSSDPIVLKAKNLDSELSNSISYFNEVCDENETCCIAIAGHTLRDIQQFGKRHNLGVLDGLSDMSNGSLFLSDLDQTKGYEFDTMIILNCNDDILPPTGTPNEEWYREACRLYVAMTRTKKQLIFSYSTKLSSWISNCKKHLNYSSWDVHINVNNAIDRGRPLSLPETIDYESILFLTGRQYLYTNHSIGLSNEVQEKIDLLVGEGKRWPNIRSALIDVDREVWAKNSFGRLTHLDFLDHFRSLKPW